jgi:hypothetical protein
MKKTAISITITITHSHTFVRRNTFDMKLVHRQHTTLYNKHQELESTTEIKVFACVGHGINLKIKHRLKIFVFVPPLLDVLLWQTEEQSYTHLPRYNVGIGRDV